MREKNEKEVKQEYTNEFEMDFSCFRHKTKTLRINFSTTETEVK